MWTLLDALPDTWCTPTHPQNAAVQDQDASLLKGSVSCKQHQTLAVSTETLMNLGLPQMGESGGLLDFCETAHMPLDGMAVASTTTVQRSTKEEKPLGAACPDSSRTVED